MTTRTLYLLDAHGLCYRAFHAVKGLSNSQGQPTNAVYGFVNALRKMLKDFDPAYFAVCFDKDGKSFRQETYQDYKIQRPPMPDDLRSQMPLIHQVARNYGLPVIEVQGYEADDLMATAAKLFQTQAVDVVVISDDKDLFQLVNERVSVYSPRKELLLRPKDVLEVFGVAPEYVADFLGLAGDASDNIPGVQGVGKVTAQKLITRFGSLENIYEHLEDIASKSVRAKLMTQRHEAFMSRDLALLRTDAPVSADLNDWARQEPAVESLYALFTDLEFHRLAEQLRPDAHNAGQGNHRPSGLERKDFDAVCRAAAQGGRCAFWYDEIAGEILITDGRHTGSVSRTGGLEKFFAVLQDSEIVKVAYDVKRQYKEFRRMGFSETILNVFDIMLAGYLLNPSRNGYELSVLSWNYLKEIRPDESRAAEDVVTAFRLYDILKKELETGGAWTLFEKMEMPLAFLLGRMEEAGVRLDLNLLEHLSRDCAEKISILGTEIFAMAGEEFNIQSPKQLSHVLFEKLKLPVIKRTKTGFSTNEEVLTRLSLAHELPQKILDYRQLAKLKSTYIDALPDMARRFGGDRLYTSFNQTGTETGRLSSSQPNLQNIPIRTELGRKIRGAFIPLVDGHVLLSADYSQIELRILAHLSGDEGLIQAFRDGEDIHAATAAQMFDVSLPQVRSDMRTAAKRVNFGIIYGISSFGLAKDLGVSFNEAQDFIDRYFLRYPRVKAFMDQAIEECRQNGYSMTLMNRRRDIPEIISRNNNIRQFAERQAINTPVQGTAADLIKMAMLRVDEAMQRQRLKSMMLITVHDEIVFDLVPMEESAMVDLVRREMESAMTLKVPIGVSLKKGPNWLEMEEI